MSAPAETKAYQCRYCTSRYESSSARAKHQRTKHPDETAQMRLSCSFCPARCTTPQALQLHTQRCPGLSSSANTSSASTGTSSSSSSSNSSSPSDSLEPEDHQANAPESNADDQELPGVPPLPRGLPPSSTTAPIDLATLETIMTPLIHSLRPTEKQLIPLRNNLRFLLDATGTRQLNALVQPQVVRSLLEGLVSCGKGSARVYALSLLLRKVVAFLCTQQSATSMAYISTVTHPSTAIIDEFAQKAGRKRKLVQRDRMAFGEDDDVFMSLEEMTVLMRCCLNDMAGLEQRVGLESGAPVQRLEAEWWTRCFVVMLFITLISPRSQTMASLSTSTLLAPGTPGNSSATQYLVRVSAEVNKAGQAFICHVPEVLTLHVTFYLRRVLPAGHQGALFRTRSGETRTDYGDTVGPVCARYLGRSIRPHKFRTSVATAMYGRADVDEGLLRGLADHVGHSTAIQRGYYAKQKRLKTGAALQRILLAGLGGGVGAEVGGEAVVGERLVGASEE